MGITSTLLDQIENLGVVEGEIDNIMEAALRDVGQFVLDVVSDPAEWPRYGVSAIDPSGPSLRNAKKPVPDRAGRAHSGDLWRMEQPGKLDFFILNDAEYSSFVHVGHPRASPEVKAFGLADVLLIETLDEVSEDPMAVVSDRILQALDTGEPL